MSGTIPTSVSPSSATSVCSWAFAPYASHHARWKTHALNGVAHGVAATSRSQSARGMSSNGRRSTRSIDEEGSVGGASGAS